MIELQNVTVHGHEKDLLDNISAVFQPGETIGIAGPCAAGKSLLLNLICGNTVKYKGTVLFDGLPLVSYGRRELARLTALPAKEDIPDSEELLKDFLLLARTPWRRFSRPFTDFDHDAVQETAENLSLLSIMDKKLCDISDGQKKIALIAFTLIRKPRVLLLDNPTDGLDFHGQAALKRALQRYVMDGKRTVIMAGSDLNFMAEAADRILVLSEGETVFDGNPAALTAGMVETFFKTEVIMTRNLYSGRPQFQIFCGM